MSSYNDNAEYASQNDSIPLDEASASASASGSGSGSYYTEDSQEIDVDTGVRDVHRRSSRNTSAQDDSYMDDTLPSGSASQITGHSEDFTGTNPNAQSYTDVNDYSSAGYGSLTYDDSTLRSPHSSSFSEMSSTFASFYYENEAVRRMRRTISFLRRPLMFFSFALVGSNAAGNLLHAVHTFAQHQYAATEVIQRHVGELPVPPGPPPSFPPWALQLRAQLPGVVENSAKRMLAHFGIPAAADTQEAATQAYEHFTSGVQRLKNAWYTSGSVVSFTVFLPVFTYCVLQVSRAARSRRNNGTNSLFDMTDGEDAERGLSPYSTVNRSTEARSALSTLNFSHHGSDAVPPSPIHAEAGGTLRSPPPPAAAAVDNVVPPPLPQDTEVAERTAPLTEALMETAPRADSGRRPGSLMSTLPPTSSADTPRTTATERSATAASGGDGVDVTPKAQQPEKATASPRAGKPDDSENDDSYDDEEPGVLTPAPRSPPGESRTDYTLDGDIVLALVGQPDATEANEIVMAANKYGCSMVLLPSSVPESRLVMIPATVEIVFCDDVLARAREVAEQRRLSTTGVFVSRVVRKAVSMRAYVHPMNVLYMFVASDSMSTMDVATNTTSHIYTGTTLDSDLPVNELLYDRYKKGRRSPSKGKTPTIDDDEL